jgi:hypothetical protein
LGYFPPFGVGQTSASWDFAFDDKFWH